MRCMLGNVSVLEYGVLGVGRHGGRQRRGNGDRRQHLTLFSFLALLCNSPIKERLIARDGKLVTVVETVSVLE